MRLRDFLTLKSGSGILLSGNTYNPNKYSPYINYSWSQTLTVEDNQQIKDTETAGMNLQQYFGQGCWFNGVDQCITLETAAPTNISGVWTVCFYANSPGQNKYVIVTIGNGRKVFWFSSGLTYYNGSANIKLDTTNTNRPGAYVIISDGSSIFTYLNGVLISTVVQTTNQLTFGAFESIGGSIGQRSRFYNNIIKDVYYFRKIISEEERIRYFNQPNQFFMDSLEDDSCVLAMPMCEKNNLVRNYKNNTDYPITNYLTTCRTNAQRLPYGLQTSGFKRDSNGLILSKSNFLECDGVGIATRAGHNETVKVKTTVNPSSLVGTVLSGGVSLLPTGMTINEDNIITLENQTPTITVAFGDGFNGTIKEYKEEK